MYLSAFGPKFDVYDADVLCNDYASHHQSTLDSNVYIFDMLFSQKMFHEFVLNNMAVTVLIVVLYWQLNGQVYLEALAAMELHEMNGLWMMLIESLVFVTWNISSWYVFDIRAHYFSIWQTCWLFQPMCVLVANPSNWFESNTIRSGQLLKTLNSKATAFLFLISIKCVIYQPQNFLHRWNVHSLNVNQIHAIVTSCGERIQTA